MTQSRVVMTADLLPFNVLVARLFLWCVVQFRKSMLDVWSQGAKVSSWLLGMVLLGSLPDHSNMGPPLSHAACPWQHMMLPVRWFMAAGDVISLG